jgi:hypothetical protein
MIDIIAFIVILWFGLKYLDKNGIPIWISLTIGVFIIGCIVYIKKNLNSDQKKTLSQIIMIVTIFVLSILLWDQRIRNEAATEVFSEQTLIANTEHEVSVSATQQIENMIKGCIGINEVARYSGSEQCVVGELVNWEESTEPRDIYTAPERFYTYFDFKQFGPLFNPFYLSSHGSMVGYIGDCVKVRGIIHVDNTGAPYINVAGEQDPGKEDENDVIRLPDDVCSSWNSRN